MYTYANMHDITKIIDINVTVVSDKFKVYHIPMSSGIFLIYIVNPMFTDGHIK